MKVYVNDFSVICSLGSEREEVLNSLLSKEMDTSEKYKLVDQQETTIFRVDSNLPIISDDLKNHNSRNNQFILKNLIEMKDTIAQMIDKFGVNRIGVVFGTSTSGICEGIEALKKSENNRLNKDYKYELQEIGSPSLFIKDYLKLNSVAYTVSTACSSGAKSFIEGKRLIESDICDAVIVGGSDSINELTLNGFHSLGALSSSRTNPMSKNRDGTNIGEGAGTFILSKEFSHIELMGMGESTDAFHISSPDPSGTGAKVAMQAALRDGNLKPTDIDYINLHGTGTIKNDEMEAKAVAESFPNNPYVSSTKPLVGHTLGAAGAIEAGFCLMMLDSKSEALPVHQWDNEKDEMIENLNLVKKDTKFQINKCMSNSYAFGGNNVSLIFGKVK